MYEIRVNNGRKIFKFPLPFILQRKGNPKRGEKFINVLIKDKSFHTNA